MTDYQIYEQLINQYLLPGDIVGFITQTSIDTNNKPLLLGNGLRTSFYEITGNELGKIPIRVTLPGKFIFNNNRYSIESGSSSLYVPKRDEPVIGQIAFKSRDSYILNLTPQIGGFFGENARLDMLSFDGASKKNKPNLQVGDWVYARILRAERDLDIIITCESPEGTQKKDWVYSDRNMFGELKGGWVIESTDLSICNKLLNEEQDLLSSIGEIIGFDVVVGANGRLWVSGESVHDSVIVGNVIKNICTFGWLNGIPKEERIKQIREMVKMIKSASESQKQKMNLQMKSFQKVQNKI